MAINGVNNALMHSKYLSDSRAFGLVLDGDITEASHWVGYARAHLEGILSRQQGATSLTLRPNSNVQVRIDTRPNKIVINAGGGVAITIMSVMPSSSVTAEDLSTFPAYASVPYQPLKKRRFYSKITTDVSGDHVRFTTKDNVFSGGVVYKSAQSISLIKRYKAGSSWADKGFTDCISWSVVGGKSPTFYMKGRFGQPPDPSFIPEVAYWCIDAVRLVDINVLALSSGELLQNYTHALVAIYHQNERNNAEKKQRLVIYLSKPTTSSDSGLTVVIHKEIVHDGLPSDFVLLDCTGFLSTKRQVLVTGYTYLSSAGISMSQAYIITYSENYESFSQQLVFNEIGSRGLDFYNINDVTKGIIVNDYYASSFADYDAFSALLNEKTLLSKYNNYYPNLISYIAKAIKINDEGWEVINPNLSSGFSPEVSYPHPSNPTLSKIYPSIHSVRHGIYVFTKHNVTANTLEAKIVTPTDEEYLPDTYAPDLQLINHAESKDLFVFSFSSGENIDGTTDHTSGDTYFISTTDYKTIKQFGVDMFQVEVSPGVLKYHRFPFGLVNL